MSVDVLAGVITTVEDNWIVCKRCPAHLQGAFTESCRQCNEEFILKRSAAERIIRSQLKNGFPRPFYIVEKECMLMRGGSLTRKECLPDGAPYRRTKLQGFVKHQYVVQDPGVKPKQDDKVKRVYHCFPIKR